MKVRTVAIIQARMGSVRFPGKMMAQLGGYPLLEWVVRRLSRATTVDQIVLATSDQEKDDVLADLADYCSVGVFRGSESDVLARFVGAASMAEADNVVRVCADNPFVDPLEVDRLVTHFADNLCDYACNHQDRLGSSYADGFGAEVLSSSLLKRIHSAARDSHHREHVTLYLWDHPTQFRLSAVPAPPELRFPRQRFDVDLPEDLVNLTRLVASGVNIDSPAAAILETALAAKRFQ